MLEQQLAEARAALVGEQNARRASETLIASLRGELAALEARLTAPEPEEEPPRLDATLLYVGGRPAQIGHLREAAERAGAAFLHHDGGVEDRGGLLPGLIGRADVVVFPVDCVSHAAMLAVKRICRRSGKPFVPLRNAGLGPFCAALRDFAGCTADS
jgi:hypothetical protein